MTVSAAALRPGAGVGGTAAKKTGRAGIKDRKQETGSRDRARNGAEPVFGSPAASPALADRLQIRR